MVYCSFLACRVVLCDVGAVVLCGVVSCSAVCGVVGVNCDVVK